MYSLKKIGIASMTAVCVTLVSACSAVSEDGVSTDSGKIDRVTDVINAEPATPVAVFDAYKSATTIMFGGGGVAALNDAQLVDAFAIYAEALEKAEVESESEGGGDEAPQLVNYISQKDRVTLDKLSDEIGLTDRVAFDGLNPDAKYGLLYHALLTHLTSNGQAAKEALDMVNSELDFTDAWVISDTEASITLPYEVATVTDPTVYDGNVPEVETVDFVRDDGMWKMQLDAPAAEMVAGMAFMMIGSGLAFAQGENPRQKAQDFVAALQEAGDMGVGGMES